MPGYSKNKRINTINIALGLFFLLWPSYAFTQNAFVSNGANINIIGPGTQTGNLGIAVIGDYLNLNDGLTDASIELDGGSMLVSGDWTNNANNTVFTYFTANKQDGYVTLENNTSTQLINGNSPTFFENLIVNGNRKTLMVDSCSVDGSLFVNSPFDLNTNMFTIKNPSPMGIVYRSGFIKSETTPGNYSYLKWDIGSGTGTYNIPFGSDNLAGNNDLDFKISLKTPMNGGDFIKFATYPTDPYNYPLPTGADPLETEVKKVVDRFWIINLSDPTNRPDVDLVFSFSDEDIDPVYNSLNLQDLKAIRNNTVLGKWLDIEPLGSSSGHQVTVNNVSGTDLFEFWTLINEPGPLADLFTPDAFSPNGDGINDNFLPVFHVDFEVINYTFIIYNRWGQEIFKTSDPTQGWNGYAKGTQEPVIGVYSWVIIVKGKSANNREGEGETKKYVGKVTLVK